MDIVIKSFNRVYLLDRAIYSLYKYVKKGLGKIIILDDGTPEVYLSKLQEKYIDIIIIQSPNYVLKVEGGKAPAPIQFWKNEIQKVSDNFLLFEDDLWCIDDIDLDAIDHQMQTKSISFTKLRWWGNNNQNIGHISNLDNQLEILKPNVPRLAEILVRNQFYLHSFADLLKLRPKDYFLQLYTYYDVAGHVFNKKFYNYVWPDYQTQIQEMIQLGLAAKWFRKNQQQIAKSKCEIIVTSFVSSSTGDMKKLGFDMDELNNRLNKMWLEGKFDTLNNFPSDFTLNYIKQFIQDWDKISIQNWEKWSIEWRRHFISMGSDLSAYNNTKEI